MRRSVMTLMTPEEEKEAGRPIELRAQERLTRFLAAVSGEQVVIPHVHFGRGKALNTQYKGVIDPRNPPMVLELKAHLTSPPPKGSHNGATGIREYETFDAFRLLLWAETEEFKKGKGRLLEALLKTEVGKFTIEVKRNSFKKDARIKTIELFVPRGVP